MNATVNPSVSAPNFAHPRFSLTHEKDHCLATFHADLDMETLIGLRPEIEKSLRLIEKPLLVDLQAVQFLDSSGVGLLALMFRHTQAHHLAIAFCGAQPQPEAILAMVGLSTYVPVYAQRNEALNALLTRT